MQHIALSGMETFLLLHAPCRNENMKVTQYVVAVHTVFFSFFFPSYLLRALCGVPVSC